jgi:hypothetical protein
MSTNETSNADGFADRIRQVCEQTPITQFLPEDIFVVAFPRSGNTWFQNLAAGVRYGLDVAIAPDSVVQELVPDVHYKQFYKRFSTPMIFKSHDRVRADYRRVVYLLRDGRDVMVSYRHYRTALLDREPSSAEISAFAEEDAQSWPQHVDEWLANPHRAELMTVRYEDLLNDPVRELRRFCEFGGFDRDEEFLDRLAKQASFDSLRAKELRFGWNNPIWPKEKPFLRRGIAGSHRDELEPEHLEMFLQYGAETLRKHGYEVPLIADRRV